MSNQQNSNDSGSFLTGLGLGLIGGAVGYFLFATDKGDKVRKQLAKEWKSHKVSTDTVSDGVTSLKQLAGELFNDILQKAQEEQKAAEEEVIKTKTKKKKKMFKGVK